MYKNSAWAIEMSHDTNCMKKGFSPIIYITITMVTQAQVHEVY